MEKFFEWFNERTQREKILLIVIPIVLAFVVWLNFIQPLIQKRNELEQELENLKATQFLVAKKISLQKKIKELQREEKVKELTLEELLKLADKYGITVLNLDWESIKNINVKKSGNKIYIFKEKKKKSKKKKRVRKKAKVELNFYSIRLIGADEDVRSFIKEISSNYLITLTGFFKGCLGEREILRRKFIPLVCESKNYKTLLCGEDNVGKYKYLLNFISLTTEAGR